MHIYFGKYEQLQSTEMNNTQTLKQNKKKKNCHKANNLVNASLTNLVWNCFFQPLHRLFINLVTYFLTNS